MTEGLEAQVAGFRREFFSSAPDVRLHTSGSTGRPKEIRVPKSRMLASARRTGTFFDFNAGETSLLCMPLRYIAGRMVCVRAWLYDMPLVCVQPSLHPLATLTCAPSVAAMTPAQVYETLRVPHEASLLRQVRVLLVGGGHVSKALEESLRSVPGAWSTYGMTETVSHIALRRLATPAAASYTLLPGVSVALDVRGCLTIDDTCLGIKGLATNDVAELLADGSFRILGRADNTVCSGGLKWQLEDLENRLAESPLPVQFTAVPDDRLGEAIVLLVEGDAASHEAASLPPLLSALPQKAKPRHIFYVTRLPQTETGKPAREEARCLAQTLLKS